MKYNININQRAIIEHELNIDLIDAAIFDVLVHFAHSTVCKKTIINGETYFLFNWKLITHQLPMSNLKTRQAIYKRYNKLCEAGLIERSEMNKELNLMLFKFGENYDKILFNTSKQNKQPVNENYQPVNNSLHVPVNNGLHNKDISNNNINIILPFKSDAFLKAWTEWKDYKKIEHRFNFKSPISEQKTLTELKNLSENNEQTAISLIDLAIASGWKGFYVTKRNKSSEPVKAILSLKVDPTKIRTN